MSFASLRRPVALALIATAGVAGFWWRTAPLDPAPLSVVVVTLDTTRADRLSAYGYMDASMPHLDRLAREGLVFDQASSVGSLTLPAHCSLFTGLFPPAHGVRDNADEALDAAHTTLAEILQAQGFRTGAFVGSIVLDPDRGLAQGFEQYGGVSPADALRAGSGPEGRQRRADAVVSDAIRWVDAVEAPRFFLWTHLYDPHRPYDPPEPYRSLYANPYIGEIAFVDSQIGRLLDALERRHLLERTMVVVAGDHGESLGAHGERDHGIFIYESVLRVPLIVRGPGLQPGRIGAVVRLIDVMPTVLDLLRVAAPPMDGVSLVDLMRGRTTDLDLAAYSESLLPQRFGWSALRALREGRFKLIEAPRPELYDLELDPFEERNVYDERRALASAMSQRLDTITRRAWRHVAAREETTVPPALRESLGALGYVGSGALLERQGAPDPKDCIGVYNARQNPHMKFLVDTPVRCN